MNVGDRVNLITPDGEIAVTGTVVEIAENGWPYVTGDDGFEYDSPWRPDCVRPIA